MLRVACPVGFVRGIVHAREVLVIAHGRVMERLSPPLHERGGVNSLMCGMVGSKWAGTGVVGPLEAGSGRLPLGDLITVQLLGRMPICGHSPGPAIDPNPSVSVLSSSNNWSSTET